MTTCASAARLPALPPLPVVGPVPEATPQPAEAKRQKPAVATCPWVGIRSRAAVVGRPDPALAGTRALPQPAWAELRLAALEPIPDRVMRAALAPCRSTAPVSRALSIVVRRALAPIGSTA